MLMLNHTAPPPLEDPPGAFPMLLYVYPARIRRGAPGAAQCPTYTENRPTGGRFFYAVLLSGRRRPTRRFPGSRYKHSTQARFAAPWPFLGLLDIPIGLFPARIGGSARRGRNGKKSHFAENVRFSPFFGLFSAFFASFFVACPNGPSRRIRTL